jgi:chlorobactene glucosyltransferase
MLTLAIVSIFTILLTIFLLNLQKVTKPSAAGLPVVKNMEGQPPMVSIIVPMRNEERNAKQCIESLLFQNYPNFEVIAVDDRSKDNTLNILKEFASKHGNLRVIEGNSVPEGWVGKNYAIWQAVKWAEGDWLFFVDADTTSEPYMLCSVIKYVEENGIDMFSISPFQVMKTFWERVIQPIIIPFIWHNFPQKKINDPKSKTAAANGQFILIRRSVYDTLGGHSAIKDKIVEDFALANLVKCGGYRLYVIRGVNLVRTRMYTNFNEIWEGWTKNHFFGLGKKWERLVFSIVILLVWGIIPPILFTLSFVNVVFKGVYTLTSLLILSESIFLIILVIQSAWKAARFFGIPRYYAFTSPLGIAVYICIIISSAHKVVSGIGVTWKERVYKL